jgi:hypothetical protein
MFRAGAWSRIRDAIRAVADRLRTILKLLISGHSYTGW